MKTICIIPARAGSKRLPGKNTKLFHDRPLLAWSIIQARHCKYIEDVYVTTDSEETAIIARNYGAKALIREHYMESIDSAAGGVPMYFAVERILKERDFDTVICLFPTSPLRKPGDIDRACELFLRLTEERGTSDGLTMNLMSPRYETCLARRLDTRTYQNFLFDKTFSYMDTCGGFGMAPVSYYQSLPVDFNDEKTWREPVITTPTDLEPHPYVPVEWWQCFEIDRPEDFDICLYFFGLYLKEQWEEVCQRLLTKKK